ncbi:tripartite tricarboxylate transporter TctB family protein [Skermanella sp. TT6]|uniref:Tripartite tricarboxylate transporter TctB family protein n=1 Tax=Skermanella cutis TaxID=2775420 RepID=A0ABX7BFC2_9PROT|nr:tripartite tricarboxylate transporter TctB family protein [Skermanella sp. TT6]QQP91127.1 tripartite tricarboxylate transporter TctB family protein [Skermanella sp. TT6]
MRINDAILGAVLLAFALAIGLYARTLPTIPGQEYGAAVFPTWIAFAIGACSLVLIAGGLRHWAETGAVSLASWARSGHHLRALGITVALVVFYILVSTPLGFIPTAFVTLTVLFAVLGVRPALAPVLAAVLTMVIHYGFYSLLRVPLPWGVLTPWAW